jgi:hypothetical protein
MAGCYALSVRTDPHTVQHSLILSQLGMWCIRDCLQYFNTIPQLIQYYVARDRFLLASAFYFARELIGGGRIHTCPAAMYFNTSAPAGRNTPPPPHVAPA